VTVVAVFLVVLAASGRPASAASSTKARSGAVHSWLRRHDIVFVSLQTDLKVISTADANGSTPPIVAACQQLSADLGTIRRVPAIPDAAVERDWAAALRDFRQGADDCVQGVLHGNGTLADRSGSLLRAGVSEVDEVLADLGVQSR
jgi:hypothetical protein